MNFLYTGQARVPVNIGDDRSCAIISNAHEIPEAPTQLAERLGVHHAAQNNFMGYKPKNEHIPSRPQAYRGIIPRGFIYYFYRFLIAVNLTLNIVLTTRLVAFTSDKAAFHACFFDCNLSIFQIVAWQEIVFLIDIIVCSLTLHKLDSGEYANLKTSVIRYYCRWFWVDIAAIMPFWLFGFKPYNMSLRLLRFRRVFQFITETTEVEGAIKNETNQTESFVNVDHSEKIIAPDTTLCPPIFNRSAIAYVGRIFKLALAVFYIVHLVGMVWWAVGSSVWLNELTENYYWRPPWQIEAGLILGLDSEGEFIFDPTVSELHVYLHAIYFASTTLTTVGYGDISATTLAELWTVSGAVLVGVASFAVIIGNASAVLNSYDKLGKQKDETMKELIEWLAAKSLEEITPEQRRQIYVHYMNALRYQETTDPRNQYIKELPQSLKAAWCSRQFASFFSLFERTFGECKDTFKYSFVYHIIPRCLVGGQVYIYIIHT
eukprot:GHVL01019408.1.p1 GENE.GHVL01019408.1~~GHVL01019408.1.p1  ORF type:complete len:489 (-),score=49.49 GHVL01019408.1:56-1522(-)